MKIIFAICLLSILTSCSPTSLPEKKILSKSINSEIPKKFKIGNL